jgi:hypothetical protein
MTAAALALLLVATEPVHVQHVPGSLHGFPSLSDQAGHVIADGELTQELERGQLRVHIRWTFRDGREVEETDAFRVGADLVQERFAWVESRGGEVSRRFEVDFGSGQALAVTHDDGGKESRDEEKLDLTAGRAFAGYGTALAVSQLPYRREGWKGEVEFVAFTPKPRSVKLEVRLDGLERVTAAGRGIPCDRVTLHPDIPFPLNLVAHASDAHLWFTHRAPPALVRAEQNLAEKDDPIVVVDVIPKGPARVGQARRGR